MYRTMCFVLLSATVGHAQPSTPASRPIPAGQTNSAIIAAAEAEGRASAVPGDTTRKCARGWDVGPAYSGEFTIGGNISDQSPLAPGRVGKIWWRPRHNGVSMPPLLVRGRNLESPKDTIRWTTDNRAYPIALPGAVVPIEKREYFFPSGFMLPTRGHWLVVATSGENWGCFILTAA